jgi:hypothetical protein
MDKPPNTILVACFIILTSLTLAVGLSLAGFGAVTPVVLPGGKTSHFSAPTLSEESKQALRSAEAAMTLANDRYVRYTWSGKFCAWASVVVTVLITLIAGSLGIAKQRQAQWRLSATGQFRILGFLAALGSAATLVGSQLSSEAAAELRRADRLQRLITQTEQELIDLRDKPDEQRAVLRQLQLERDR